MYLSTAVLLNNGLHLDASMTDLNKHDAASTVCRFSSRLLASQSKTDVAFMDDSFTYGRGLRDDETYPQIYCIKMKLDFANLGEPSTGTFPQFERLRIFHQADGWHP